MDTNQIKFKAGEMQTFIATRKFELSSNPKATIYKGTEVLFDGNTVQYQGYEHLFPQLRGAIKAGWLVLAEDYDENDASYGQPVAANIQMRPATEAGDPTQPPKKFSATMAQSDERVVRSVAQPAGQVAAATQSEKTASTVVVASDGVPVRSLKTVAGSKSKSIRTKLTGNTAQSVVAAAGAVTIDAGQGRTEEEMLAQVTDEEREEYLAKKQALKSARLSAVGAATATPVARKVVGSVKSKVKTEAEGFQLNTSVGGGVELLDLAGTGGAARESVVEEEGIMFRNTNGPKKGVKLVEAPVKASEPTTPSVGVSPEVRRNIAKALCPDFPANYDFALPAKKKLARLQADYEDRPDIIRAVFAAEVDSFKALLVEEFPAVFQG